MEDKFTKKCKEEHYTIVYFDVLKDLQIDFTEYIVLQTMLHFSNRSAYNKGITKLSSHLNISRNTVYKTLKSLVLKNHIIEVSPKRDIYFLNYDIREKFEIKGLKFVKIYHKNRKHLGISIAQYVLLYMIYSLSKNRKSKIAMVNKTYYQEHTGFSDRYYYNTKNEFIKKNLLDSQENAFLKLNSSVFNWFENN